MSTTVDLHEVPFDLSPPRRRKPYYPPATGAAEGSASVADCVEAMLRHRGDWREPTRRNCRHYLCGRRFTLALHRHGIATIADLTTDFVEAFLEEQRVCGLAPKTREGYRRYLRALALFQAQVPGWGSGLAAMDRVRKPPMARTPPVAPCLSREEEDRVRAVARPGREQLLVELLLATGIRVSELCGLTVADTHLDARRGPAFLHVRGSSWDRDLTKSFGDRRVPFRDPYQALPAQLAKHLAGKAHDAPLFCSQRGLDEQGRPAGITVSGVEQLFARLSERARIHVFPHLCRHTWATRLVDGGMPMFHLQQAGGWKSIEMVRRYYRHDSGEMFAAFARTKC